MEFFHIAAKLKRPSHITASREIVKARLARGILHFKLIQGRLIANVNGAIQIKNNFLKQTKRKL